MACDRFTEDLLDTFFPRDLVSKVLMYGHMTLCSFT